MTNLVDPNTTSVNNKSHRTLIYFSLPTVDIRNKHIAKQILH